MDPSSTPSEDCILCCWLFQLLHLVLGSSVRMCQGCLHFWSPWKTIAWTMERLRVHLSQTQQTFLPLLESFRGYALVRYMALGFIGYGDEWYGDECLLQGHDEV